MSAACRRLFHLLLLAFTLVAAPPGFATEDDSRILVAHPELKDGMYGATILITKAMPDGSSVGFILNKPTPLTLGQLFPGHAASLKVPDPIFLGGPIGVDVMFALVQSHDSPGADALQVAPDLYLAVAADTVDRIIETGAEHARFLVGMVVWRPGELNEEMRRGLWYEMKTDTQLVLRRKTEGLWEELVRRSEQARNTI